MGIALGDVDGDGLLDFFVTHLTEEIHTLWRQRLRGLFQDQTGPAGLASPAVAGHRLRHRLRRLRPRWRPRPGHRQRPGSKASQEKNTDSALGPFWSRYAERNQLFGNDGAGHFRDISGANAPFCGAARVSRGLACGDIDGDGALDLLVTTVGGPARLYRNVAPKRGHWLLVRLIDPALRRDAYGARVRVQAGERRWVGIVSPGQSYLCSCDPRVHFGLGQATHVDRDRGGLAGRLARNLSRSGGGWPRATAEGRGKTSNRSAEEALTFGERRKLFSGSQTLFGNSFRETL